MLQIFCLLNVLKIITEWRSTGLEIVFVDPITFEYLKVGSCIKLLVLSKMLMRYFC